MNWLGLFILIWIVVHPVNLNQDDFDLHVVEKERVIRDAASFLNTEPITVTNYHCKRSAGSIHDFYSEGDYWWPDPKNPDGPYIRKDGLTNPENFTAHRFAMIRLSKISGALASAYIITQDDTYILELMPHLRAWFIDPATKMNPNLLYGQAISGRVKGRGIGIIDTIHLMEVALAVKAIEKSKSVSLIEIKAIKSWFESYLQWITSHPYGIAERDNGNNHSVCWAAQVAVFASLLKDETSLNYCREFYKNTLLPQQMAQNGSFPLEIKRTKPYGYSLFTLDAMTSLCQILTNKQENLFEYQTVDGKNIGLGLQFLYPYVKNKETWPYTKDVMYWEDWPVRGPAMLFGGIALNNMDYIKVWQSLSADFNKAELIRNVPVRYPLLWY